MDLRNIEVFPKEGVSLREAEAQIRAALEDVPALEIVASGGVVDVVFIYYPQGVSPQEIKEKLASCGGIAQIMSDSDADPEPFQVEEEPL